jgi:hypothetical protein
MIQIRESRKKVKRGSKSGNFDKLKFWREKTKYGGMRVLPRKPPNSKPPYSMVSWPTINFDDV